MLYEFYNSSQFFSIISNTAAEVANDNYQNIDNKKIIACPYKLPTDLGNDSICKTPRCSVKM